MSALEMGTQGRRQWKKTLKAFQRCCCVMENKPVPCMGPRSRPHQSLHLHSFIDEQGMSDSASCLVRHFQRASWILAVQFLSSLHLELTWQTPDDQTLSTPSDRSRASGYWATKGKKKKLKVGSSQTQTLGEGCFMWEAIPGSAGRWAGEADEIGRKPIQGALVCRLAPTATQSWIAPTPRARNPGYLWANSYSSVTKGCSMSCKFAPSPVEGEVYSQDLKSLRQWVVGACSRDPQNIQERWVPRRYRWSFKNGSYSFVNCPAGIPSIMHIHWAPTGNIYSAPMWQALS